MKKPIVFLILCAVTLVIAGCDSKEIARLEAENDSLRSELETRYSVVSTMGDIKVLLDSIDESRKALHLNLNEGTTFQDFSSRLGNINNYVKRTEEKITTIEKELKSTRGKASAYMMMVSALKDELSIRASEVEELENQVNNYKKENTGLLKTVKLQENELGDMHAKLTTKQQELSFIEAKVDELVENFKFTEAEAYYARAQAVEEAGKRTKLAPQKKKETYREALELYNKALSLGKEEAKEKITELQKKLR
jgi:chromosome segregation ATPase